MANPFAELYTSLPSGLRSLRFDSESQLIEPGDPLDFLPWVEQGRLRVLHYDDQGRGLLLYNLLPGETCVISAVSAYQHLHSPVAGVAEAGTVVRLLPVADFRRMVGDNDRWKDALLLSFEQRYEALVNVVYDLAFRSVEERLWNLLLQLQREAGGAPTLAVTHQTLAGQLGTDREVVTRALRRLAREGRLDTHRGEIRLRG